MVVEYSFIYGNAVCSTVKKFIIGEMEGMNVKVTNTFWIRFCALFVVHILQLISKTKEGLTENYVCQQHCGTA